MEVHISKDKSKYVDMPSQTMFILIIMSQLNLACHTLEIIDNALSFLHAKDKRKAAKLSSSASWCSCINASNGSPWLFHASHLSNQCSASSISPLSHSLHTLSSLATPRHLPVYMQWLHLQPVHITTQLAHVHGDPNDLELCVHGSSTSGVSMSYCWKLCPVCRVLLTKPLILCITLYV